MKPPVHLRRNAAAAVLSLITVLAASAADEALPRLKASENKRFLTTAAGKPFFWLGDTAWELFHRLNREEATRYLEDRASKGFTVIQAVALAELEWEKRGMTGNTTVANALVPFKGRWRLDYGGADTVTGLALGPTPQ